MPTRRPPVGLFDAGAAGYWLVVYYLWLLGDISPVRLQPRYLPQIGLPN